MKNDQSDLSVYKNLIREQMILKESEELAEIYMEHDSSAWTTEAFEVIQQILIERGIQLVPNGMDLQDQDLIPQWSDEDLLDEEDFQPDLRRINWQNDSVEVIYRELSKLTTNLNAEVESFPGEFETAVDDDSEYFSCIACNTRVRWESKICPECGLEFYPSNRFDESAASIEKDKNEPEIEELAIELRQMSTQELSDLWFETNPTFWDHNDLAAIRRVLFERNICLPFLLDAPQDLMIKLPYLTEEGLSLRGSPGYRNRPGRSGLDYIDTTAELNRMEGLFIANTFKLKLRTKNPIYILALLIASFFMSYPTFLFDEKEFIYFPLNLYFFISSVLGIFYFINALLCIRGLLSSLFVHNNNDSDK